MARILVISSFVAHGAVGLQAMVPPLQALGHEVIAIPTTVLSNHPGLGAHAGAASDPAMLERLTQALDANGWLSRLDGIITGYLPSEAHVMWGAGLIGRVEALGVRPLFLCDPVLGDDPRGLYIDERAATCLRQVLLPLADVTTPNRFELSWLSGCPVEDRISAAAAARRLPVAATVATSIPEGEGTLCNLAVSGTETWARAVPKRAEAAHGTGDLFAALLMSARLEGLDMAQSLEEAAAGTDLALEMSAGWSSLAIPDFLRWLLKAQGAVGSPCA